MTPEQIQLEINKLYSKIRISNKNIDSHKAYIRKMEDEYDKINSNLNSYKNYIQNYRDSVLRMLGFLDRDSCFGDFYKSSIDSIFNGNENSDIINGLNEGKKTALNKISEYEEKINAEQRKINNYRREIERLEQEFVNWE